MGISLEELQLATRNHGTPLEALRLPVTPVGLHFLLAHSDVPLLDAASWRLRVRGERAVELSLADLRAQPAVAQTVTLECAGNGRALLEPRVVSQPWLLEAVGTARWSGVPLRAVLDRVGVLEGTVEVVFRGADRGRKDGAEHAYARSLPLAEALRDDVLLAHAMNGLPLPPQHGFPVRLVVPGWYGMASVKWLTEIELVREPFRGYYQAVDYLLRRSADDPGVPLDRMRPRALLVPPGVAEHLSSTRHLPAGACVLVGRAWAGAAPVATVEVSLDGGGSWQGARLDETPLGEHAWRGWSLAWNATPGRHELVCRARDAAGNEQPLEPEWNLGGYANNAPQRVVVAVAA